MIPNTNYEYYIVDSENNWLYHKLNCVNAPDGSLAIINTDAQQNEVVDLILQYTDGLENVALNKSANQSSDIDPLETEDMASKGVDGDIDQCTETYSGELVDDHWWRVDLGRNYAVLNVTVYNNVSAGGGTLLSSAEIRIGDSEEADDNELCGIIPSDASSSDSFFDVSCGDYIYGRYVSVEKMQTADPIALCEVEVWAVPVSCVELCCRVA
ncbi:fucolectin-like [Saccoglossus kowalevskii]